MDPQQEDLPSVIDLNVGGRKFTTRLSTLRKYPDSMLAVMFSGRHKLDRDKDGNYFIDRNGDNFSYILEFLRDNQCISKDGRCEQLLKEAEYFGLLELVDCLKKLPPLFPVYDLLKTHRESVEDYLNIKEKITEIAQLNATVKEETNNYHVKVKVTLGKSSSAVKLVTYTLGPYEKNRRDRQREFTPVSSLEKGITALVGFRYKNRTVILENKKVPDFQGFINTILYDLQHEGYNLSVTCNEIQYRYDTVLLNDVSYILLI